MLQMWLCLEFPAEHCLLRKTVIVGNMVLELSEFKAYSKHRGGFLVSNHDRLKISNGTMYGLL